MLIRVGVLGHNPPWIPLPNALRPEATFFWGCDYRRLRAAGMTMNEHLVISGIAKAQTWPAILMYWAARHPARAEFATTLEGVGDPCGIHT